MAKNLTFDQVSAILPQEVVNHVKNTLATHLSLEDNMGVNVQLQNQKCDEGEIATFAIRVTRPIKKVPQVEQELINMGAAPVGSEIWFHRSQTKFDRGAVIGVTRTKYKARTQDGKVWTIPFRSALKDAPTQTINQRLWGATTSILNNVPDLRP